MTRADRITAVVLFALGVAMLAGGFFMDRLEVRRINPASIPGLVPMLLGATLALCAVVLFRSTCRDPAEERPTVVSGGREDESGSMARLVLAAGWSVFYALLLVGRLPFTVATAIYIAVFVIGFGWSQVDGNRVRAMLIAKALLLAIAGGWGIATLFSEGFLVRLP